ncbi:DUF3109 family protein [Ammoniphilus sp. YIM 78166]|uniref:DUF3109 family protein n=1 Tax=Ammoniphilus sp. YIM 78166 TaxID=1644106 RepID=UPI00106FAED9|nr:DUF3109 family protein [Ammoniphilus sp. YIM 78166]
MPSLNYYGTNDALSSKEAYHYKKYMKRANIQTMGRFHFDPVLFTPVNLDCLNCKLVHSTTCCEGGQPYSMKPDNLNRLHLHAQEIIQTHLDPKRQKEAQETGYIESVSETFSPTIKDCEGDCFFLGKQESQSFCSIHRYALENKLSPWLLKPFSCSLFPLDIIEDGEKLLITAITPETAPFSRWGKDYEHFFCVNYQKRKEAELSPELFSLKNFKPAWTWSQELLEQSFGKECVEWILQMEKGY